MALRRLRTPPADFRQAVTDPVTNALVSTAGIPRLRRPAPLIEQRTQLIERALSEGPDALNEVQRNVLLYDPLLLARLHARVWTAPVAHPDWGVPASKKD